MFFSADGGWTEWNEWECSDSPITTRIRYRTCTMPKPANGGSYCAGDAHESATCASNTASTTPICYPGGTCGCEKDTSGADEKGDGSTKGSCSASTELCYDDGSCRSEYINVNK